MKKCKGACAGSCKGRAAEASVEDLRDSCKSVAEMMKCADAKAARGCEQFFCDIEEENSTSLNRLRMTSSKGRKLRSS